MPPTGCVTSRRAAATTNALICKCECLDLLRELWVVADQTVAASCGHDRLDLARGPAVAETDIRERALGVATYGRRRPRGVSRIVRPLPLKFGHERLDSRGQRVVSAARLRGLPQPVKGGRRVAVTSGGRPIPKREVIAHVRIVARGRLLPAENDHSRPSARVTPSRADAASEPGSTSPAVRGSDRGAEPVALQRIMRT